MKNLIYTICDHKYKNVFELFVKSLKKNNYDIDICCICDNKFKLDNITIYNNNIYNYNIDNFDYKYTGKFLINKWNNYNTYDNFLYLDTDILCYKKIDIIFDIIEKYPYMIHCVKEKECLNDAGNFHKFSNIKYDNNEIAYNAGSFGFNKKIINIFNELLLYIEKNKQYAICDQPLFNEFFITKKIIYPTLSPYIFFDGIWFEKINNKNIQDMILKHYVGGYGLANDKLEKMKKDINQIL